MRPTRVSDLHRVAQGHTGVAGTPGPLGPGLSPLQLSQDTPLAQEAGQSGCCRVRMELSSRGPVFPQVC